MIAQGLDAVALAAENHRVACLPAMIRFSVYELDPEARELRREGRLVRLPPQAFRLLVALVSVPGEVVSRDQLRAALWPDTVHVDFERSLNSAMRKLRVALQEDADRPRYIQTLHGHGYRFIAPVHHQSGAQPSGAQPSRADGDSLSLRGAVEPGADQRRGAEQSRHRMGVPSARAARWRRPAFAAALLLAAGAMSLMALAFARWRAPRDSRLPVAMRAADARAACVPAPTPTSGRAIDAYCEGQAITGDRLSELSRAIERFETGVELDPQFASAWAALARARASRAILDGRDRSELRQARTEAQRALAADSALSDAHLALGQVRFALDDDPAGAEIDLRRARALGATSGRDLFWLLWVLKVEGRTASALRVVDEALATEPENAQLHAWRGLLLHAARRYDEELAELQRALAIDEDSWMATLQMGLSYSRRRDYARALPALRRAVALSDGSGLTLTWLGRISADAGDIASAEQTLHQLSALTPTRGLTPSMAASIEYHLAARRSTH